MLVVATACVERGVHIRGVVTIELQLVPSAGIRICKRKAVTCGRVVEVVAIARQALVVSVAVSQTIEVVAAGRTRVKNVAILCSTLGSSF